MNTQSYGKLNPVAALGPAWSHAKKLLFPFSIGTWFTIGLMVFLEQLAGSSGNFVNGSRQIPSLFDKASSPVEIADKIDSAMATLSARSGLIAAIGIPAGLFLIAFFVLILWLSVRGQLMFAYAVSTERILLKDAWKQTTSNVPSLFKFQLVLAFINWVFAFALLGAVGIVTYRLLRNNETNISAYVFSLAPIVAGWALLAIIPGVVTALLRAFVVPLMVKKGITGTEGFHELMPVLKNSIGGLILYFVLQWLFAIGIGIIVFIVTLLTCCIGALPIVAQTIFAPFWVFERAWSMFMLKGAGTDFDVFESASEPSMSTPPPTQHDWNWTDSK